LQEIEYMKDVERAAAIRGKTDAEAPKTGKTAGSAAAGDAKEKPQYAATRVADEIYAVSYLAASGYTLTVVLTFRDQQLVGFASSAKDWHPVRGTFQVVK